MRITFNTTTFGKANDTFRRGETYDVPEARARELVKRGLAAPAVPETPAGATEPTKPAAAAGK